MSNAEERIAALEEQVARLQAQLGVERELPTDSIEARLRALLGDPMLLDALPEALSASGMGIWTYFVTEDRVVWDATTAKLFGVSPEKVPRNFAELLARIHPADCERLERSREETTAGAPKDLEVRVVLEDGTVRHLLSKGTAVLDESGETTALLGGVLDVTTLRELQAQLQLSQRMQAVGQLTSGVAHNLNNMLSVILPNAELCREAATGELAARADDLTHAARRAAELVRQLMLFARPQSGAEKRPFDLIQAVRRVVEMCQKTFDRRIAIELEARPVPNVRGDEGQIEQALLNICLNARDALIDAETEAPRICVDIGPTETGQVRVIVRDNGPGMDEAVRARVFEPFFSTKDVGRGSGLGLASAYSIVAGHGGSLRCASELGRGTTFEIVLPASAMEVPEVASQTPSAAPAVGEEHILVVDDEVGVRRILASLLERAGYRVETCASGDEALRVLDAGGPPFDLILLDRSMPGMSGEQVVAHLTARGSRTPIVLVTGDPGGGAPLEGVEMLLGKPLTREELLRSVRTVLDRG